MSLPRMRIRMNVYLTNRYSLCSTCSFEHFMTSSVINKSTDARKTVCDLFFTTNLNWQAGRALKFEGNCGVKQTKKRAILFRMTFPNTSAIINNFSHYLIGVILPSNEIKEAFLLVIKMTDD